MNRRPGRPWLHGFASLPMLLLLLAGAAFAQAILEVALRTRLEVGTRQDVLEAESAAEGAARAAPLTHPGLASLSLGGQLPLLNSGLPNGSRARVVARRISPEVFVLEATGVDTTGRARIELGRVVWRPDPATRLASFGAIVESGGPLLVAPTAQIDNSAVSGVPPGWPPGVCTPHRAALASALPRTPPSWSRAARTPWIPALGPLDVSAVVPRLTPVGAPSLNPVPVAAGGVCQAGPANWGSPSAPLGPCGGRFVAGGTPASLTLTGGEGQGVLAVGGDLRLDPGVWFSGVALVGGALHLGPGARLDGFAVVGGAVVLGPGSRIVGSGCAALRALEATVAVWPPTPLPEGGWIDPY